MFSKVDTDKICGAITKGECRKLCWGWRQRKIENSAIKTAITEPIAGPYFQRLEYEPLENGQRETFGFLNAEKEVGLNCNQRIAISSKGKQKETMIWFWDCRQRMKWKTKRQSRNRKEMKMCEANVWNWIQPGFTEPGSGPYFQRLEYKPLEKGHRKTFA